ncbi:predicted protein [Sclerotinia sclerotiorum 1980 UF-70]|uniref:Uncharacterized protein n=1 Tax=Sclerotinia sclerotiorum (strain ATCC 18683 / 1980 / Ss-1) TaxID=665079 RepID=A7EEN4_SCLS1|nr:predicted protein [Sclerotinia sclerotiorum 1980 UF-70]EDO01300.1 predicted protein [Sclerotinia sclerotiorum 1980 UF-70]
MAEEKNRRPDGTMSYLPEWQQGIAPPEKQTPLVHVEEETSITSGFFSRLVFAAIYPSIDSFWLGTSYLLSFQVEGSNEKTQTNIDDPNSTLKVSKINEQRFYIVLVTGIDWISA